MALLVGLTTLLPAWADLGGRAFDTFSTASPPRPDEPGVVIVAIDEPSFEAFGEGWPWPRERHAELITALQQAGAKAIGFDVVFADPSAPDGDKALIDAMDGQVVLAASEQIVERDYGSTLILTEPLPDLLEAGAKTGVASLSVDGDGVLRKMPAYSNSFMATLLTASGDEPEYAADPNRLIQYFDGPGAYPTVSYYQALEPDIYLEPGFFEGQVVLIGLALQTDITVNEGGDDAFETPFTAETRLLTPGVEVQATIFDNLKHGLSINEVPGWVRYVAILAGVLLGLLASRPRSPAIKFALAAVLVIASLLGSWVLLRYARLWVSPAELVAALLGIVIALAALDFARERRRRREVQGAFGQYVAPTMVKQIISNPKLLKLGGERKDLTILFADIRGFTTISELMKDDPEGLVALINRVLNPLSDIVIEHRGTIDKYMGDCIMAFWNAPLDDPDHAKNALAAGQAMMKAMPAINQAIAAHLPDDAPEIKIGIGINSGSCVVGNMGSDQRFDYSVLGDAVNTASRLEGACKDYQVPIVIGQATVQAAGCVDELKQLDTLAVRGKTEAISIYTVKDV
ncbi:adenylate/guanylate cyclase domain-containing protein [Pontixanthobacter sp. CEM42]|uniref:CHASE2 domain-containing protein n=1 Tax=Pontixanthobacter sp. CEM42 TaxID=2792077 RepID=UPI001ADEE675